MNISKEEIKIIKKHLEGFQKMNAHLSDELLDHYCLIIESKDRSTSSFEEAFIDAKTKLDHNVIANINAEITQIIHPLNKFYIMKLSFLFLAFAIIFNPFGAKRFDPPETNPLKTEYRISACFGNRIHPINKTKSFHQGIDLIAPLGTPVYAPADGIATTVSYNQSSGHYLELKHDDIYKTSFKHLEKIIVKEGTSIKKGTIIGTIGSSGLSTGPHLHYEIWKNDTPVDPESYFIK